MALWVTSGERWPKPFEPFVKVVLRYRLRLSRTDAAPGIADADASLHSTDAITVASYRAHHES